MEDREKKEERNKRIGWLTSVGVQLVLLILFYFMVAWKEPFPPIPEYGIELGFTTSAGAPATSSPSEQAPQTEEIPDETTEETEAEIESNEEREEVQEEVAEPQTPVAKVETPVKVEESKPAESKPKVEKQVEEKPKVDSRAVMKPSKTKSEEISDNPSEGDAEEKKVDQRAIYGSQGTNTGESEGANLSLSGWVWDFKPKPDDTSDQSGKIVYKIAVDQDGYLVKIETITSTVSPTVERKYRTAVEKLTFSKTADYKTAPVSSGTITFIIKSK